MSLEQIMAEQNQLLAQNNALLQRLLDGGLPLAGSGATQSPTSDTPADSPAPKATSTKGKPAATAQAADDTPASEPASTKKPSSKPDKAAKPASTPPAEETKASAATTESAPESPSEQPTVEQVIKALTAVAAADGRAAGVALLAEFKAKKVGDLKAEQYADVIARANDLVPA